MIMSLCHPKMDEMLVIINRNKIKCCLKYIKESVFVYCSVACWSETVSKAEKEAVF